MGTTSPKGALGSEERAKLLDLIRGGFGVQLALAELKTHWRRYERTLKKVRGFRAAVSRAVAYQTESLVSLRYSAALDGSERAQEFLINRADRAVFFAAEMKRRRTEARGASKPAVALDPAIAARMLRAAVEPAAPAAASEPATDQ